jgi:hypothetical protein
MWCADSNAAGGSRRTGSWSRMDRFDMTVEVCTKVRKPALRKKGGHPGSGFGVLVFRRGSCGFRLDDDFDVCTLFETNGIAFRIVQGVFDANLSI